MTVSSYRGNQKRPAPAHGLVAIYVFFLPLHNFALRALNLSYCCKIRFFFQRKNALFLARGSSGREWAAIWFWEPAPWFAYGLSVIKEVMMQVHYTAMFLCMGAGLCRWTRCSGSGQRRILKVICLSISPRAAHIHQPRPGRHAGRTRQLDRGWRRILGNSFQWYGKRASDWGADCEVAPDFCHTAPIVHARNGLYGRSLEPGVVPGEHTFTTAVASPFQATLKNGKWRPSSIPRAFGGTRKMAHLLPTSGTARATRCFLFTLITVCCSLAWSSWPYTGRSLDSRRRPVLERNCPQPAHRWAWSIRSIRHGYRHRWFWRQNLPRNNQCCHLRWRRPDYRAGYRNSPSWQYGSSPVPSHRNGSHRHSR